MAGRAVSRAKFDAEQQRLQEARELPTEPRALPATYSPDLIPELLALADKGLTDAEVSAHWNITEDDLKEWANAHPPFKAAVARARTRAKAWWERSARLAMAERDTRYPAGLFSHVMRARYSEYDDKAGQVHLHFDIGRLVMMDLRAPELPSQQMVTPPNPLIEHDTGQLAQGLTASHEVETGSLRHVGPGSDDEGGGPG
jgi:hypothetical protein